VPFLPIRGFQGSDLPASLGLKTVRDPYGDEELVAIPSLRPDWALIHVPEADARGNARIYGTPFWDRLMARAARRVLVSAERILPSQELARQPELTAIPELFVEAVVHAPRGAWPGSCHPNYDVDYAAVEAYLAQARDPAGLRAYLERGSGVGGQESGDGPGTGSPAVLASDRR
jgi:glutaconate CoA-transferase subunit A